MMLRTITLAVVLVTVALAGASARTGDAARAQVAPVSGPASAHVPSTRTGDVIVRFRAGTGLATLGSAAARARTAVQASTAGSGLVLVRPAAGESVDDVVARLRSDPAVEFAEPNTTVHVTTTTPNDTYYASQKNLTQTGVPTAWDTTTGGAGTTVAVLDTGVDATHEDLAGGRVIAGYNFIANNTNTADDNFHGTFVAGIIAASANNAKGVAGICWTCNIMPVKVLDASGNGDMFRAAQGIDWAVAHGAKVVNMSFGGGTADAGLQTSVDNAWAAGVVLVAASGNDSHGAVLYPAAFTNVIAVGSVNGTDALSSFSNVGSQLDLVAPGEGVTSTLCNCGAYAGGTQRYGFGSGTSFASPEVAGVAALMIGAGTTSNATIVSRLESTAADLGTGGFDNNYGWGRLDAAAAVGDTTPPTVSITSPAWMATASGVIAAQVSASDNVGVKVVKFWMDGVYQGNDPASPFTWTFDTTALSDGTHRILVEADDVSSNKAWAAVNFNVANSDRTAPTVSITSPAASATVSTSVTAQVSASDNVAVKVIKFWMDGIYQGNDPTPAYSWTFNTTALLDGTHRILVEADDFSGNRAWAAVNINVSHDTTAPTVSISSPASNATVSGSLAAAVSAWDNGGVKVVKFWMDGVYQGNDATAPYTWAWDTTTVANGTHRILVEADDLVGNKAWAAVNFAVSN